MQRTLVERAQAGDRDAFDALARSSSDRLFAMASLILGDVEAAQDALQEALVTAWRDMRALREPDAWDAWLNRLTVRACYKLARRERRRSAIQTVVDDDDPALASDQPAPIHDRDQVERGFRALTADQRAIVVLHFYLGLALTDAAVVLGVPVGTVKSRLHRGLLAMRALLERPADVTTARPQERTA